MQPLFSKETGKEAMPIWIRHAMLFGNILFHIFPFKKLKKLTSTSRLDLWKKFHLYANTMNISKSGNINNGLSQINTSNAKGFANLLMPPSNAAADLLHVDSNLNLAALNSPNSTSTIPQPPPMPNTSHAAKKYKINHEDMKI
uniref:Uncharacterized protein n=1 Tax=Glossina brevipalpis TaxID=37001 RepID=A0A1A9W5Z3_9MUSC